MSKPDPTNDFRPPSRLASTAVLGIVAAMLATWIPHYLTWPWWPDTDAWAAMALGWDSGIRPYRDVSCINFPGPIYICWALGRLFGWGRTAPLYALDAALLVAFGGLLAAWGRRVFASALPGLIGWAGLVSMYCGLNYAFVAQRDWQGPLLAVASLLMIQGWPGRGGRLLSAGLLAAGFIVRPHVVLFLAPVVAAIECGSETRRETVRRVSEWGLAFGLFAVLMFSPLIVQGLIGDFVRGVQLARYGGGYGKTTLASVGSGVLRQLGIVPPGDGVKPGERLWLYLAGWRVLLMLAASVGMLSMLTPIRRRQLLPWIATLIVALFYAPLHPKPHVYLVLPLRLVVGVVWGLLAGVVLERIGSGRAWWAAFAGFLIVAVPGVPAFCLPVDSYDAVAGRQAGRVPPCATESFAPGNPHTPYWWDDYRETLIYLRARTGPDTRVAAFLRNMPFPGINGTVGRVSPLPAESGIIWLWSMNRDREGDFVRAIERMPPGSVAVWSPGEQPFVADLVLAPIASAIRRGFRPEARFGAFEVWRKPLRSP